MITITKDGNAIKFTFVNNGHYLTNGEIEVPLNSLSLVTDDSGMATFKKSASNDIFISATYEELGMSKADLESWYKENMVGETGGGGGGGDITSGEVQTMIDESISGKADSSAVTEEISAAVSGKADISDIPDVSNYFDGAEYDSGTTRINFYHGNTVKAYIDASAFIVDGMIDDVRIETISGVTYLVIDFNTASGKEDIQIPITDIFDSSNYYNKSEIDSIVSGLNDSIDEKLDASAYTPTDLSEYWTSAQTETAISNATSGKADTSAVTESISAAVSGKVDTSTFETYSGTVETAIDGKANKGVFTAITNTSMNGYPAAKFNKDNGAYDLLWYSRINGTDILKTGNTHNTDFSLVETSAVTSSVTSASTDAQVPSAKAVYDAISAGGGGGSTYSAGTNISIDSANTISCTLPMFSGSAVGASKINHVENVASGLYSNAEGIFTTASKDSAHAEGNRTTASGNYSHAEGYKTTASNISAHAEGQECVASGEHSHAEGYKTTASTYNSHTEGYYTVAYNADEHASGKYNISNTGSTDADKTLFSVGNGTADNARHNAFEIRQNGDIYITSGSTDIKLQDHLGGGGIDSGTVQTMIDDSISGKADSSAVTEEISAAVSGKVDTSTFETYSGTVETALSGKVDTSAITSSVTSASTDSEVPTAKAVHDAISAGGGGLDDDFLQATANALYDNANGLKDTNDNLAANYYTKTQGDARYASNTSVASKYYNKEYIDDKLLATAGALNNLNERLDEKQDQLIAGSGITISGNVISATGGGGGSTYSAGTNIDITNDIISCTIPAYRSGSSNGISLNVNSNNAKGSRSIAGGSNCKASSECSVALGYNSEATNNNTFAMGQYAVASGFCSAAICREVQAKNTAEFACGQHNVSNKANDTFGDSGNTLFSVGNGTANNAKHNAFEIKQNGDIYCSDGTNDVKLQDTITATAANTSALGGLKLVQLTQAEYDALVTKDSSTLYVITNN